MIKEEQLFLPLQEFENLKNKMNSHTPKRKVINLLRYKYIEEEKKHFERINSYLDCFKIFDRPNTK